VSSVTRNVCIIAHVDHGKTTLADSVLSRAGVLNDAKAGQARAMDTEAVEQEHGITVKSTGISLQYPDWPARLGLRPSTKPASDDADADASVGRHVVRNVVTGDGHLRINLIDCPGHVDFSGEVTSALRVSDGAVVVVDCVEGVGVQTETVVRQALTEHVQPVLFLNKLDRVITELQCTPEDAYMKVLGAIERVNELIETYQPEGCDFTVDPRKGTVGFGSGLYGWGVTLPQLATHLLLAKQKQKQEQQQQQEPPDACVERLSADVRAITKRLWGDVFVDPASGKWRKVQGTNKDGTLHARTFCAIVLQPIFDVYAAQARDDRDALLKLCDAVGAACFTAAERHDLSTKDLRKGMMKAWLPVADAILCLVDDHLPSPLEAQPRRIHAIYQGAPYYYHHHHDDDDDVDDDVDGDDEVADDDGGVLAAMRACDPAGPTMVFITKMIKASKKGKALIGFGRVFSGTLRQGDTLFALDADYAPARSERPGSGSSDSGRDDNDNNSSSSSKKRVQGAVPVTVKGVQLVMAGKMQPIKQATAGMVVGVLGLDRAIVKTGTLASTLTAHPFKTLRFSVSPVVRVSVRAAKPGLSTKLQQAMSALQQQDPCVQCYTDSATGETILAGVGELNVQLCLRALGEAIDCEVKATEPAVQYCESVGAQSSQVCLAKSSNKHNRLYVRARPLGADVVAALDNGAVTMNMDAVSRTRALVAAGMERAEAKKVVAIAGTNVLLDETVGLDLSPILDMVSTVFKEVCDSSVLCAEELRGAALAVVDARLHQDSVHRRADQVFPMARRALFAAIVTAAPVLLEPVFEVTVQVPQECMAGMRRVLKDRGGAVVEDVVPAGTPLHTVRAHLPVAQSFGFNGDLMSATSGKAFPTTNFSHWARVGGDPLDPATVAGRAVAAVRTRKRMAKPAPPTAADLVDKL